MSKRFSVVPPQKSIGFLLYLSARHLKARFQRCMNERGFDITPEQYTVLSQLWEADGIHQSRLAEMTFKDRHNMTRIIQVLERKGLIHRRQDAKDARLYRCFLTDQGIELKERLISIDVRHLEASFQGLDDDDLAALRRTLLRLLENLEEDSAGLFPDEGASPASP